VTTILRNPGIAGLSVYKGEIVGAGEWEPLVSDETWRAVVRLLDDPARKPSQGVRTFLGGPVRVRQLGNRVGQPP
jgi:site-specific DNA recombinase